MSDKFNDLVRLLRELFQLDQPDLDFGLYRIMHAKSGEVTQFLEKDLLPQVKKAFEQYQPADKVAIKKRLDQAAAESLGVDPDTNEKVLQLRAELAEGADLEAMESDVYDHLYSFFRRYYSEGDFLAKRVYKPGVYAVPYEGEEVVLHWANKDQYYIKTSEYLRDYAFRLKPDAGDAGGDPMRVHFRLVAAAEGEHGNNKAAEGKDRVFVLAPPGESGHDFLSVETVDGREELVIGFEYRPATMDDWTDEAKAQATAAAKKKPPKQKDLIDIAVKAVLATTSDAIDGWPTELAKPHTKVNGETAEYSRLQGHLNRYCARHTFDYFIHKNLGGFLRRELDFYIKNEVMHLNDVQNEDAPKVEQYLSKIKVIRTIAGKVIDFLQQLEEFQRRIWLKQKFVTRTEYLLSVAHIPQELIHSVAANASQVQEWVELFKINEIDGSELGVVAFSEPLTAEFVAANPQLVVDTRHFMGSERDALVAAATSQTRPDGILINADNHSAMRLAGPLLAGTVSLIFIDPPYNTGVDGFPYKDNYQHSSWMSMMYDRLTLGRSLLRRDGLFFSAIDFVEVSRLRLLCDEVFGPQNFLADVAWEKRYTRSNNAKRFYSLKDTLLAYRASEAVDVLREARTEKSKKNYTNPDNDPRGPWISSSYVNPATKADRPNLVYPIARPNGSQVEHPTHAWKYDPDTHRKHVEDERLYWGLDGSYEYPRLKSFLSDASDGMVPIDVWHHKDTGTTDDGGNALKAMFGREVFKNPKPPSLVRRVMKLSTVEPDDSCVVDFFAGSGTTGSAVLDSNRENDTRIQFVLVESGEHFETVLVPRIKKSAYASEWTDGRPAREGVGGGVIIKYCYCESYEDSLANLHVQRSDEMAGLIAHSSSFAEKYLLQYMLSEESRGSASLLNVRDFEDPCGYHLHVQAPGSSEGRLIEIDLIETFNWLLGLRITGIAQPTSFTAAFHRDSEGRLAIKGRIKEAPDGRWWFRTVTGTTPDGKRALIIWRKRPGGDEPEGIEQDNAVLDAWFRTQGYSTTDNEFDIVWVNGDNNLANLRQDETPDDGLSETGWKVRIIEQDFHRLMFDTSDVPGGA